MPLRVPLPAVGIKKAPRLIAALEYPTSKNG
jgi:hypothetical protein